MSDDGADDVNHVVLREAKAIMVTIFERHLAAGFQEEIRRVLIDGAALLAVHADLDEQRFLEEALRSFRTATADRVAREFARQGRAS